MKTLVISGINLFEGGPLSIYYDCLNAILDNKIDEEYKVIAFVHKKSLFLKYSSRVSLIELPKSRKSYIYRLWYEYDFFYRFSRKNKVDIWLSLHDITPRVKAGRLYTYCHNPSPFMKKNLSNLKYGVKNVAFSLFYKYLYRINIRSNTAVIVQQDWMRKKFLQMYPIENVIVARPNIKIDNLTNICKKESDKFTFIFASFPRFFKNFDVICQATQRIKHENFEIWLTLDGTENKYSRELRKKYENVKQIKWLGLQTREKLYELYEKSDAMIFPSTLETWGLPISEFKQTGKPMLLADLPYAHETLGTYDKAVFFDPYNALELKTKMIEAMHGCLEYNKSIAHKVKIPYADNWKELFEIILK